MACVLLFGAAPAFADALALRAAMHRLAPSVVRVEAARGDSGPNAMGTGVVIAPDRVATNCHVLRHAASASVVSNARRWDAVALQSQPQHDVCILTVPGLDLPVVEFAATDSLLAGSGVIALGYSGGFGLAPSNGVVTALHAFDGAFVVQSDAGFSSGASGGGLFDDAGRLVGLLTFRLPARGAYFFSVPVEWVRLAQAADVTDIRPQVGVASFWEGRPTELPYFLRATTLEAAGNVSGLLELTSLWLEQDPASPQAQAFRQRALSVRE